MVEGQNKRRDSTLRVDMTIDSERDGPKLGAMARLTWNRLISHRPFGRSGIHGTSSGGGYHSVPTLVPGGSGPATSDDVEGGDPSDAVEELDSMTSQPFLHHSLHGTSHETTGARTSIFLCWRRISLLFTLLLVPIGLVAVVACIWMILLWRNTPEEGRCLHSESLSAPDAKSIQLIGHRGSGGSLPENTMSAMLEGVDVCGFIELDLQITADAMMVLMHDETLQRTTNGSGLVCQQSWAYVSSLIIKGDIDETVPTFESVLTGSLRRRSSSRFLVDVKPCTCSICGKYVSETVDVLKRARVPWGQVAFSGSDAKFLRDFRAALPTNVPILLSVDLKYSGMARTRFMSQVEDFDGVSIYHGLAKFRPDLVKAVKESQSPRTGPREAFVWTVDDIGGIKTVACLGLDTVITNQPRKMLERLGNEASSND